MASIYFSRISAGRIAGNDVVIDAAGGFHHPAGHVLAQLHAPDAGVVPQEAVAQAGDIEGDADLGVALLQVDHAALVIQQAVLVLAQAKDALAGLGAEVRSILERSLP